jgi:hypothetical protein
MITLYIITLIFTVSRWIYLKKQDKINIFNNILNPIDIVLIYSTVFCFIHTIQLMIKYLP